MAIDFGGVGKAFVPKVFNRAIASFDRASMVIVLACWGGAILLMLFALYTLNLSVTAKTQVVEAAAQEPQLPLMVSNQADQGELEVMVDRLKKRFPDIAFDIERDRSLSVTAQDGGAFRTWLAALTYIETISPQLRWKIKDFCVGARCGGKVPMMASLTAEKVSFTLPNKK